MLASLAGNDSAMIGSSPAFRKSLEIARQVAGSAASVLMMGESGTGKEVMARYIHQHSRRASGPFISINCAAIPSNLLESELFGHEKGAFTGAIARRVGKFEEAHQGTLLLDEITEMAPEVQAKLLRALQERVIDRVGGSQPIAIDIRVLATTNRSIVQAVRQGVFREDLYYRLNTIEMVLPPLRERQEDIVPLAEYFIDYYSRLNGLPLRALSPEVAVLLKHYPWPGNIRELENRMHRAVLLSSEAETITAGALGWDAVASNAEPWTDPTHWLTAQKSLTQAALAECSGDQKLASMLLGLSLRALASAE
jgi:transcriptional regulator with PAS, ATPase and Fis domain